MGGLILIACQLSAAKVECHLKALVRANAHCCHELGDVLGPASCQVSCHNIGTELQRVHLQ